MEAVEESKRCSVNHEAADGVLVDRSRFGKSAKLPDGTVHRIVEDIAVALVMQLEVKVGCGGEEMFFDLHSRFSETPLDGLPGRPLFRVFQILFPPLPNQLSLGVVWGDGLGIFGDGIPQFPGQKPLFLRREFGNSG